MCENEGLGLGTFSIHVLVQLSHRSSRLFLCNLSNKVLRASLKRYLSSQHAGTALLVMILATACSHRGCYSVGRVFLGALLILHLSLSLPALTSQCETLMQEEELGSALLWCERLCPHKIRTLKF